MRRLIAAAVAALLAAPAATGSPSFDCARAGTPTEHAICAAPILAELDSALAAAYAAARSGVSEARRQEVQATQRAWLAQRDACGGDRDCLERLMRARLVTLAGVVPRAVAPSFDCGRAGTATEHAICASPRLAGLDAAIAGAYAAARSGASEAARDRIRSEQVAWLARRNECGGEMACLAARMEARLADLRGGRVAAVSREGISGIYCMNEGRDALVVEVRGDAADFAFSSWQGGGHHCGTPMLTARREGAAFVARDGDCTLRLTAEGGGAVLAAEPFEACKMRYCGARAAMGRLAFPAASRRPLPAPAREIRLMEGSACR